MKEQRIFVLHNSPLGYDVHPGNLPGQCGSVDELNNLLKADWRVLQVSAMGGGGNIPYCYAVVVLEKESSKLAHKPKPE